MNKLFNWTFGSIFRTFGRIIAYLLVGALFSLILSKNGFKITDLLGIERVSAKTFSTTEQYRVYKCDSHNDYEGCDFTSWTNVGTSTSNTPSNTVVRGFSMNFAQSETLSQGGLFRVVTDFTLAPNNSGSTILTNYTCWGVNSNSTSGGLEENIQSCELVSTIPTTNGIRYIFNVIPAVNIKSIKINIYLNTGQPYTKVTGLAKSNLSNDTSTSDAINNQTDELLDNQNKNAQDIMDNQNQLLGTQCTNIFNPTLTTATTHRGITFTPVKNSKTNRVIKYWVNGTRTSGSNAYINVMSNLNLKKGTKIKVWGENKVALQLYYTNGGSVIRNVYDEYTLTEDLNGISFDVYTTQQEISSTVEFKAMVSESTTTWCEYGTFNSKLDETTNSINDLKDSITDSSSPSISGLNNETVAGWLPAGPIDAILNLPLTFLNSVINGMSGTCQPLVVPLPYVDLDLPIPCMSGVYNQMGFGSFFNWVGNIAAAFILFAYLMRLYKYVDDTLTFRENNFIDNWSGV